MGKGRRQEARMSGDAAPPPPREGYARDVIAFASMAIALCSLGFAVYQGSVTRWQQRLSVRPWLAMAFYHNQEGAGWKMSNPGLGPAVVKWFEVRVDDEPKGNWREVVSALGLSRAYTYGY